MATTREAATHSEAAAPPQAPQIPTPAWLTSAELRTLEALCEALFPAVSPPSGQDDPYGLYARSARDRQVARRLAATLADSSPQDRAQLKQFLNLLRTPPAGLLLAGRARGFAGLTPAQRERALQAMSVSPLPQLRQGFQAVKRLAAFIFYAARDESGANPSWPALGYAPAATRETAPKTIRTLTPVGALTLSADAIVIGSGAGGGVAAAELAAAGKDVLVLEQGGYYNESDFDGDEAEGMARLYLRRGLLTTRDLGMIVLAGSCLGGGTVVNWSTSLRTPPDVLEEWQRHGFSGAASMTYQRGFDLVEERLGVNVEDSAPNRNNATLQRGCAALGYQWRSIPRNAAECAQRCGACGFGCPYGRKQSTLKTYLQDASDRGARTLPWCRVERVLIEAGRATGVEGWALNPATGRRHRVTARAPLVVVAAGAVESPALLLRSGLANPHIGRHLRLHPVMAMVGYYDEPVEAWSGSLQTVLCDHFAQLKDGYGVRIELAPAHPGLFAVAAPWSGGQAHKELMTRARYAATFIVLTRDTGEGHVTLDRQGDPVLHYWPNQTDRYRLLRGAREVACIAAAGGANGVATLHTPQLELCGERGLDRRRLEDFEQQMMRRGIQSNRVPLFSAHQMGSCRIGASPREAVANPEGQVYGVRGLYIADASAFPTASGVNPMISVMALAHHVAQIIGS